MRPSQVGYGGGGGRARRPAEAGTDGLGGWGGCGLWILSRGKVWMRRLHVLAAEGREILELPARTRPPRWEKMKVHGRWRFGVSGGGRFGKEINWIARVSFVQLTCGPGLKY